MPVPALGALLVLGVLVGCATSGGGDRSHEFLSDWQPPAGQRCHASEDPEVLPPAEDVFDPLEFAAAAREALPDAEGYVLLSIWQDSTGVWQRVAPIESDLTEADQERLAELLRPRLSTDPTQGLRLRLRLADEVTATVGRQHHCVPAVANREMFSLELESLRRDHGISANVVVQIQVLEDGTPGVMALLRGSGNRGIDALLLDTATRLHFHPGLSDRIPTPMIVQLPVIVQGR